MRAPIPERVIPPDLLDQRGKVDIMMTAAGGAFRHRCMALVDHLAKGAAYAKRHGAQAGSGLAQRLAIPVTHPVDGNGVLHRIEDGVDIRCRQAGLLVDLPIFEGLAKQAQAGEGFG